MNIVLLGTAAAVVGGGLLMALRPARQQAESPPVAAAAGPPRRPPPSFADLPASVIAIRPGPSTPLTEVGFDESGAAMEAACSTCHTTRPPNAATGEARMPSTFHTELAFSHGGISCLSCHGAAGYDQLRMADGAPVAYEQVMTLCGQCHGSRARDYEYGAHGGRVGYWDLARGGRKRNNCVDCHDPHAPAFPPMAPSFRPIDRFLAPQRHSEEGSH